MEELEKPGRDPRNDMPKPILRTDVLEMKDLKEGMVLKGTVRNVIDFGAFVDIGVHQDGLVHISQMSEKYIKHPLEVVSVGDVVDVQVTQRRCTARKRIQLTMRIKYMYPYTRESIEQIGDREARVSHQKREEEEMQSFEKISQMNLADLDRPDNVNQPDDEDRTSDGDAAVSGQEAPDSAGQTADAAAGEDGAEKVTVADVEGTAAAGTAGTQDHCDGKESTCVSRRESITTWMPGSQKRSCWPSLFGHNYRQPLMLDRPGRRSHLAGHDHRKTGRPQYVCWPSRWRPSSFSPCRFPHWSTGKERAART